MLCSRFSDASLRGLQKIAPGAISSEMQKNQLLFVYDPSRGLASVLRRCAVRILTAAGRWPDVVPPLELEIRERRAKSRPRG